ncbi:amidohydrolase [Metabacillus arenae]|uniref:Amidohydrolase family protein n=1 Tax=Metabacillus arenae TaxID=2771434 RepID=A0A926NHW4_9BACI|nr:amidohydrolase [Metabacillus arenae]MBD1380318.1 amidohydrolase family protein [Metabacillus arenae]
MIINNVRIYQPYSHYHSDDIYHVRFEKGKIEEIRKGKTDEIGEHIIEANERTIAPSFIDSHMHLLRYGLLKKELDLRHVDSWEMMKEEVAEFHSEMEEHDWISGKGFDDAKFDDIASYLTAKDLDQIHLNKKIFFLHQDGHECVVNDKVLDLLKEEENFKLEPDDFKETDDHGNWNGRFKDTAVHYIKRHFLDRTVEDAKLAIEKAIPHLLQFGITTVHTDDLNFIGSYDRLWRAYRELEEEGKLPITVFLHHYIFNEEDLKRFIKEVDKRTGQGSTKVKVGAIKIFLDGTQRLHTAAMRFPYHDKPQTYGNCIYTQQQLNEMLQIAGSENMQVAMHAIGDRAVEQALEALEQNEAKTNQLNHRIVHAQTLGPDLIEKLERVKPYIETQPSFLLKEWNKKEKWAGKELAPYCDAFGTMQRRNIPFTLSSDCPIGELNPFETIFAAVNRTDKHHQPEGGWMPKEKLSLDESYYAFTTTPVELELTNDRKGKIEKGFPADFVLLSHHPHEVDAKELRHIEVIETWIDGKRVY